MQRSSNRTILISLCVALLFGLIVLWASVEVQKKLFVWWDGINATRDHIVQPRLNRDSMKAEIVPEGPWDEFPAPDAELRKFIKLIEENEKLYANLEMSISSEELVERKEYSTDGKNWSDDRNYIFMRKLFYEEKNLKTQEEIEEKIRLYKRRIPRDEIDDETYDKVNNSIRSRSGIVRFQSHRDLVYQDGKIRELYSQLPFEIYRYPKEIQAKNLDLWFHKHPLQDLQKAITPENLIIRQKPEEDWDFSSFDGIGMMLASESGRMSRIADFMPTRLPALQHRPLYELFGGGTRVIKRFSELFSQDQIKPDYFSDIRYLGTNVVNGEPVVVLDAKTWRTGFPDKIYTTEKLYFAINKNYLLIKQEVNFENYSYLNRVRLVTSFQEIAEGIWFPEEVIETEETYHPQRSGGYMEYTYSPYRNAGYNYHSLGGNKKIIRINNVSLKPDYPESIFTEIPGLNADDQKFNQITDQFVKHVIAGEDRQAEQLIAPGSTEEKLLDVVRKYPLEGLDFKKANLKMMHNVAGAKYPVYKTGNMRIPFTYLFVLLAKNESGKWKVVSCHYHKSESLSYLLIPLSDGMKQENNQGEQQKKTENVLLFTGWFQLHHDVLFNLLTSYDL